MRFEIKVAMRHLLAGGGQTVLTILSVAIAAMVVLFVQITISGMQTRLISNLVDTLPHITIKAPDNLPDPLDRFVAADDRRAMLVSYQQPRLQQRTDIEAWRDLLVRLSGYQGVRAVAANVGGSAFMIRGTKRRAVTLSGGEPVETERVSPLQRDILAGRWLDIGSDEVVIGVTLAREMRLAVGDRTLLVSSQNVARSYRVAGIFSSGNANDLERVYLGLRPAQSLLATGQNVSTVQIKLYDAFQAEQIARQLSAVLPYKVESWMTEQGTFLSVVNSQNAIRIFLTSFVLLASSVAVASIMIVSVLQKRRQIGILKSMGARDRQILTIFTLEGIGVAILGAAIGLVGVYFAMGAMSSLKEIPPGGGKPVALFTLDFNPVFITQLTAIIIAATIIASAWPAYKASRLNPVEVIRG